MSSTCNHVEGNIRIFLHVKDILRSSYERICICATDTDVVVLALSLFDQLGRTEI